MVFETAINQIKNTKEEIVLELQKSLQKNNVVGIFTKDTRELITTAVKSIEEIEGGETMIILEEIDLHGYAIERNSLRLSNIEKVIHFSIGFDDPQYVKVRRIEKFKV
jgi:hypothetical protein